MGSSRRGHENLRQQALHQPLVGELGYETFTVNDAPGQVLVVYHAEPDSPAAHALTLLGSMNAPGPKARTPTSERG
ncbi:MmyB family transcriptional regulator [Nocardia otitidiscaviarum]|uniref:MmyB family transcriptional regulator n=1 Tax=Nocardia otitidiscaviarum TaxID=1823 RepID=UPI001893FB86|nr:hypothetical protein [Nocardia otitidiscaviarum]MBF6179699.1 hypothetical protein [Nocardia otitidiscaviarum]